MKLLHGYFLHTKTPSLPHRLNTPKGKKIFLKPPRKNLPYSKISLVAISIALPPKIQFLSITITMTMTRFYHHFNGQYPFIMKNLKASRIQLRKISS